MSAPLTPAQARQKHASTFNRFVAAYPRKTHLSEAANVWARLMEAGEDPVRIVRAATEFAGSVGTDLTYCPGPHRWLENGRYDDASLFQDETAALKAWLKQMWKSADARAVENRFGISMPKRYPPDDLTDPEAIRFWFREAKREWITEVYRSKVEKCQTASQPTTQGQSKPYSEQFSTSQESLLT